MKIAYLSTFYPYRGGIAQFNAALYNHFQKKADIKAYTFSLQYPDIIFPGKTQMVEPDDNVIKIDAERILNAVNPFSYFSAAKKIVSWQPDLMLTKFWLPYFAPSLGYVAGKVRKQSTVISILDNVIPHELRYGDLSLVKYFLNRNDGFIVMSETVKKDLLSIKPDARYLHQPHPLYDHFGGQIQKREARSKLGLPHDKKIILYYGFIRDYKGVDLAVKAMKELDESYHLVIAGEVYGSFEKYQKLIDDLGLSGKISVFTKYISDEETPFFFSGADVCLLPYKSATQSGIIAISYHFDLPVIATNVGSLTEMIEPYGAGIMIAKPEEHLIAEGIKKYFSMHSNDFLNNINLYKQKASWENLADSIINFAEELKTNA